MKAKQKWVKEEDIFFPISGDTTLLTSVEKGVYQLIESQSYGGKRLGLHRVADKFTFSFKVYDLGVDDVIDKIFVTWNSKVFIDSCKNLGVIFNGIKGTGKTIAAKLLSNKIDIPIIIVSGAHDYLVNFVQALNFECVILLDEAEKTFEDASDMLLKMIDGVYNEKRKLYILTTNNLTIDDNLIGRPGRIRYIKQFGNLTTKAVMDYVKDNLHDITKTNMVLDMVDSLEISTIDILKAIVDEINIHGNIDEKYLMKIPRMKYYVDVVLFEGIPRERFEEFKYYITEHVDYNETIEKWLDKVWIDSDGDKSNNMRRIESEFNADCGRIRVALNTPKLELEQKTRIGVIVQLPDANGFFVVQDLYDGDYTLCCVARYSDTPSLYRGNLQKMVI